MKLFFAAIGTIFDVLCLSAEKCEEKAAEKAHLEEEKFCQAHYRFVAKNSRPPDLLSHLSPSFPSFHRPLIPSPYTWVFALSCIFSFACAFGIGANDVANAFASSVGAKALTMPQAILVAAFMEFGGAVLLGASVTDTIKGGIAKPAAFANTPDLFMWGFFSVMVAAAFWDNFACHAHLPVSTTHTTVGATVGMALAIYGGGAVNWFTTKKEFPYISGMTPIILSWIISPVIAGFFVLISFGLLRLIVLRSRNSFDRSIWVFPACTFLVFFTITVFIIQTYLKNKLKLKTNKLPHGLEGKSVWIGAVTGGIAALLFGLFSRLYLKPKILAQEEEMNVRAAEIKARAAELGAANAGKAGAEGTASATHEAQIRAQAVADIDAANFETPSAFSQKVSAAWNNFRATRIGDLLTNNVVSRTISYGATYKVHDHIETDDRVAELWARAEVFDFKTERLFRYLQVFTACAMSFAHGSNDVANAMGPFAAIYSTWINGKTPGKQSSVQPWILALGGAGIVTGLVSLKFVFPFESPLFFGVLFVFFFLSSLPRSLSLFRRLFLKEEESERPRGRACFYISAKKRSVVSFPRSLYKAHSFFFFSFSPPFLLSKLKKTTLKATYGYKIMAVLAVKSAKLTNSRGFCVELSAAMTVVLASRFGLPVSTTMIACGAILTVGLMEGAQGVNWRLALRIFVGWVSPEFFELGFLSLEDPEVRSAKRRKLSSHPTKN